MKFTLFEVWVQSFILHKLLILSLFSLLCKKRFPSWKTTSSCFYQTLILKRNDFDHASINASQKDLRIFRSSRSQMFSKIGVLQKLCRIHKKAPVPVLHSCHLCNFVKKQTLTQIFSCEFCEIFLNNFFHRTPLDDCFLNFVKRAENKWVPTLQ